MTLTAKQKAEAKERAQRRAVSRTSRAMRGGDDEGADDAIGLEQSLYSTKATSSQIKKCQKCNANCKGNSKCERKKCATKCAGVDPNDQEAQLDLSKSNLGPRSTAEGRAEQEGVRQQIQRRNLKTTKFRMKKKKRPYTTEPMPDYIMRALQPKESVHSVYGKLRY